MAYDPYSRGDNPWLGNLDMPRSNPGAKPGASRAASLQVPKKKPAALSPIIEEARPKPEIPLPPPRPVEHGGVEPQDVPIPPNIPGAPAPAMPPVRPTDIPGAPAPAMPPVRPQQMANIPSGILQPGFFEKLFGQRPVA